MSSEDALRLLEHLDRYAGTANRRYESLGGRALAYILELESLCNKWARDYGKLRMDRQTADALAQDESQES